MKYYTTQFSVSLFSLFIFFTSALSAQTKAAWVTPHDATLVKNPLTPDNTTLSEGKKLYTTYCTPCHGLKGKGDGAAAASLNPKPADHTSATVQNETDGSLFWKISEGHTPMPQYKAAFSETQRWELVNYIRTLAKPSKK
ncbi:MAG: cytochrome c [Parafilimonas sp.]